MGRRRDLMVANGAGLLVVVTALLLGWREAAAFGLVVLVVLDLMLVLREWSGRPRRDRDNDGT